MSEFKQCCLPAVSNPEELTSNTVTTEYPRGLLKDENPCIDTKEAA